MTSTNDQKGGIPLARTFSRKKLTNTTLLKEYASWIYCENCNETIGYLCYTSYEKIEFDYECSCGNKGDLLIDFSTIAQPKSSKNNLKMKGNRLCCPLDDSPLITVLDKKLASFSYQIVCNNCEHLYRHNG